MVRFYSCDIVERGGDAFSKWAIIRNYVENNTIPTVEQFRTHHMMRWAINVPVVIIQKIFGTHPNVYYIWPIAISTLGAVFCFFIGRNMYGPFWGLIPAVIFIFAEPFHRQGSQFLPMGPATVYLLGAVLFFQMWVNKNRLMFLFLCGTFLFLSYGAKVTGIYYVPAFLMLFYYFSKTSGTVTTLKPVVIFAGLLCCYFLCEAIVSQKFTEIIGGRLVALAGGVHVKGGIEKIGDRFGGDWKRQSDTLLQYLSNIFYYARNLTSHKIIVLYYLALLLSIKVLVLKQQKFYTFSLLYLSAFFIPAYAIVRVFPFVRPETMLERYQTFLHILALLFVSLDCIEYLKNKHLLRQRIKSYVNALNINKTIVWAFNYKLILLAYTIFVFLWLTRPVMDVKNGWAITKKTSQLVREAKENHKQIFVISDPDDYEKKRNVWKYHALFGDPQKGMDQILSLQKEIPLLFEEQAISGKNYILVEDGQNKAYLLLDRY
jgi:hypothetical protein